MLLALTFLQVEAAGMFKIKDPVLNLNYNGKLLFEEEELSVYNSNHHLFFRDFRLWKREEFEQKTSLEYFAANRNTLEDFYSWLRSLRLFYRFDKLPENEKDTLLYLLKYGSVFCEITKIKTDHKEKWGITSLNFGLRGDPRASNETRRLQENTGVDKIFQLEHLLALYLRTRLIEPNRFSEIGNLKNLIIWEPIGRTKNDEQTRQVENTGSIQCLFLSTAESISQDSYGRDKWPELRLIFKKSSVLGPHGFIPVKEEESAYPNGIFVSREPLPQKFWDWRRCGYGVELEENEFTSKDFLYITNEDALKFEAPKDHMERLKQRFLLEKFMNPTFPWRYDSLGGLGGLEQSVFKIGPIMQYGFDIREKLKWLPPEERDALISFSTYNGLIGFYIGEITVRGKREWHVLSVDFTATEPDPHVKDCPNIVLNAPEKAMENLMKMKYLMGLYLTEVRKKGVDFSRLGELKYLVDFRPPPETTKEDLQKMKNLKTIKRIQLARYEHMGHFKEDILNFEKNDGFKEILDIPFSEIYIQVAKETKEHYQN